ncbi:cryptochrome/photolyase family protein [Nocardioides sambongensis]|uniref:cryptochrome/photolyase family protein n=1 Tax=Nocardioides sambongensis TaxID=2589074 RepID=UPI00112757A5|nr:deoxyribodipyrimidine photo-lyase [Nocardioides sambongensis]
MSSTVLWFRRDLRLRDHPALHAAADAADRVVGLFVLDPALWEGAGPARRAWLAACLEALDESMGGRLVLRYGDPAREVPAVAGAVGAAEVHVSGECTPYGMRRDRRVAEALGEVSLVPTGTPYAVDPGRVRNKAGEPYRVFTPFSRAWRDVPVEPPQQAPDVAWAGSDLDDADARARLAAAADGDGPDLPAVGEDAAVERWRAFVADDLADYAQARDLPAADRTSRMSPYLRFGVVHPRQLLHQVRSHRGEGRHSYETELAWREFYADVLLHHPDSAWRDLRPLDLDYDEPGDPVEAWRRGETGFPIVDAGMRQLAHQGWMHNRVRMITASFLTKDLHVWWPVGARHFLDHLTDGDLASNNHGWQWVAGTGTDAAPYFRVFNPVTQGIRFDPSGDYVRRWVPELEHLAGAAAHEPWKHAEGYDHGYPEPIVDHADERREALARYDRARA